MTDTQLNMTPGRVELLRKIESVNSNFLRGYFWNEKTCKKLHDAGFLEYRGAWSANGGGGYWVSPRGTAFLVGRGAE